MPNLTYQELLEVLQNLPPERLLDTVTVYLSEQDEHFAADNVSITKETDVLDTGHAVINVCA